MAARFKRGDLLIYKMKKQTDQPGPRAHSMAAAVQSGKLAYVVDKFWIVTGAEDDGTLEVQTRRGKRHRLYPDDPNLHRACWWKRIRYRSRYRQLRQDVDSA